jgi:aspartate aminotransferase
VSGTSFGAFGDGFLRFSYAANLPALKEAVGRIGAWLDRRKPTAASARGIAFTSA